VTVLDTVIWSSTGTTSRATTYGRGPPRQDDDAKRPLGVNCLAIDAELHVAGRAEGVVEARETDDGR
jgi:hypothetical protein